MNNDNSLARGHGLIKEGNIIVARDAFKAKKGLFPIHLIFLRARAADAPADQWEIVLPENVPECVRDPQAINMFIRGNTMDTDGPDGTWFYRAEEILEEKQ
jgi:hypothetical protein